MNFKPTEEYFELLNQAVARELQVSIQYFYQHAKMEKILRKAKAENILLDKTTYDVLGEKLKQFSIEEMKHLGAIMERIYYLGGDATTVSAKPIIGESLSEFAKLGVKAEEEALALYAKIIQMARKLGDPETRKLFQKIYSDEEEHLFEFHDFVDLDDLEPEELESFPSEWTNIFDEEYFKLLNKAVASEVSAIIQYTNQHEKASKMALRKKKTSLEAVTDKNKAEVISDMLKEIALEEMEHLEEITERIFMLGGECVVVPEPIPKVGNDQDEWIKLDHKAEDEAIVLYRKIVEEATKKGDITTKKLFEDILMDEEKHYWMFDDYF